MARRLDKFPQMLKWARASEECVHAPPYSYEKWRNIHTLNLYMATRYKKHYKHTTSDITTFLGILHTNVIHRSQTGMHQHTMVLEFLFIIFQRFLCTQ